MSRTTRQRSFRLRALGGVAGPAAFTAAWVAATARQPGYSLREEHISGLAAPDARHPKLMAAGFLALGVGTIAAGSALEEALGGWEAAGWAPRLVQAAGIAALAAGVLRRDQMLLGLPEGVERQSWKNDGHDIAAGVAYICLVAAPMALAVRVRHDPRWRHLAAPALVEAVLSLVSLAVFASEVVRPWNGVVQRAMVTLPAAALATLSIEMLRRP